MRTVIIAAAALLAASAGAARAAEYTSIVQSIDVARPLADVMRRTGGFCDVGAWFKTTCVITSGQTDRVGAVRRIADRIDEVLVAKTAYSYTYAQPLAPNSYHGTVEYQPLDAARTRIVYSLFYDLSTLPDAAAKAADRDRRAKQFKGVLDIMKAVAEAP
jgi:hypothetical protein